MNNKEFTQAPAGISGRKDVVTRFNIELAERVMQKQSKEIYKLKDAVEIYICEIERLKRIIHRLKHDN